MRSKQSLSDEYETPYELIHELAKRYDVFPRLDVACKYDIEEFKSNGKCYEELFSSLDNDWLGFEGDKLDVWCNPPHSKNKAFVKKAYEQWKKHNINIMMILPNNTRGSKYWMDYIEGVAEHHTIPGRIRFLYEGKPCEDPARNSYTCIIWRKRNE